MGAATDRIGPVAREGYRIKGMERPKREEGVKIIRQGDFKPKPKAANPKKRSRVRQVFPIRPTFKHEREMCAYVIENLEAIEADLDLYEDRRSGKEYPLRIRKAKGRIDILAVDGKGGLVVIECKRGRGLPTALGQLLGYMGWVKEHLCTLDETVRGVLVVGHATPMLLCAVRAAPLPIVVFECPWRGVLRRVAI